MCFRVGIDNIASVIFCELTEFLASSLEDPLLARVVAGEYSLNEVEGLEQYKGAVKVYRHPLFNNNTKVNDLALIEVF